MHDASLFFCYQISISQKIKYGYQANTLSWDASELHTRIDDWITTVSYQNIHGFLTDDKSIFKTLILSLMNSTVQSSEECTENEYYDVTRSTCLDRCGANNEFNCTIDFFCSTKQTRINFDTPICLNHCYTACGTGMFCNPDNAECESCDLLCVPEHMTQCRVYCCGQWELIHLCSS